MKRDARRLGVGTLLITVLIILASLFIMAMMQYFAGSVTKGKRILAHIAATDYANEAALDEAVLWFKGHCNNPQSKHKQKDAAQKLHAELVKSGDSSAETEFDAEAAGQMFKALHKDLKIEKVKITVDKVQQIGEGKLPKGKFFETEGLVHFAVTSKYETTKKTSVRSLHFRQVVVAPPRDFSNYHFVATNLGYLSRRVRKYLREQEVLKDIMAAAAQRIYFAFSMLTYIAKPDDPAVGGGGPFMVGKTFIDAVNQKAIQMKGGLDGVAAELEGDGVKPDGLAYWRKSYNNPNFNLEYVKAMAGANTNNLTKVLSELKSEFGFKPGEGGALSPSDPYPLSNNANETTDKVLGAAAGYGFKPAQKWGVGGSLDADLFKPADIQFNSADGGKITLENLRGAKGDAKSPDAPRIVIPRRRNAEWRLSELEFFIHPPPHPKETDAGDPGTTVSDPALEVKGLAAQDVASVSTRLSAKDIPNVPGGSDHFKELAKAKDSWGESFKDLGNVEKGSLSPKDYNVPAIQLHHPKSFPDWAFRFPIEWWKDGFSKHYEAFKKWREATKGSVKHYRDKMAEYNEKYGEKLIVMEPSGSQPLPEVPQPPELYKRVSYHFESPQDFKDAMTAVQSAAGGSKALVLNGVYFVGPKPADPGNTSNPAPAPAPNAAAVTLDQENYVGQGELITSKLEIKEGMKAVKDKAGHLVLYSAGSGDDQVFELKSAKPIEASLVTNALLKTDKDPLITGVFVIKDVMCKEAAGQDGTNEYKQVEYYYRRLPNIKIKNPDFDKPPVNYSHMTFSPYRVASGGARRAN